MASSNERIHIQVFGRVQNVGFRSHVLSTGSHLGLAGWVRNIGHDQVETVAEGSRPALEKFLEAVKAGPLGSRVDDARVEWLPATGDFQNFNVRFSR